MIDILQMFLQAHNNLSVSQDLASEGFGKGESSNRGQLKGC
jgi:hypothetical protein